MQVHHHQVWSGWVPVDHSRAHHLVPPTLHVPGVHCLREEPPCRSHCRNHNRRIPGMLSPFNLKAPIGMSCQAQIYDTRLNFE